MTLRELGFASYEEVSAMGLTNAQYFDFIKWMMDGRRQPWYVAIFERPHLLTGWEVNSFIRGMARDAA